VPWSKASQAKSPLTLPDMASTFFLKDYFLIWLTLVLMGLLCRPLMPVDETRAVSVAWEMWQRGDYLVPHLNGLPYSHKPPLLQWCILLSWSLFGVNEWTARLVGPLFALGNLVMTAKLSRRLWPDDETSPEMAPLLLLALPVWALLTSFTLYDMLATFFTLLGLHGIIRAAQGETRRGWMLFTLAIGLGLLSKGPATLIMLLPTALFAPWWLTPKAGTGWRAWYGYLLGAMAVGAFIALVWAVPASLAGGEDYRRQIFWDQTAGRISQSFAHQRPVWWYLAMLPLACLPWTLWPPLWRSARGLTVDSGLRFCAVQSVSALLFFSMVSGKQLHYLLPLLPMLALPASRALSLAKPMVTRKDQAPFSLLAVMSVLLLLLLPWVGWVLTPKEAADIADKTPLLVKLLVLVAGIAVLARTPNRPLVGIRIQALAVLGLMLSAHLIFLQAGWPYYSLQTFADRLAVLEKQGIPIAFWRKYNGDFNFLGRLPYPLVEIGEKQKLLEWMNSHRLGYVVLIHHPDASGSESGATFAQYYRGSRRIMLWKSADLNSRPENLQRLLD
jgi:4-amino-4-deoxy-L-arabinose transferase-like glycosyltransferase